MFCAQMGWIQSLVNSPVLRELELAVQERPLEIAADAEAKAALQRALGELAKARKARPLEMRERVDY